MPRLASAARSIVSLFSFASLLGRLLFWLLYIYSSVPSTLLHQSPHNHGQGTLGEQFASVYFALFGGLSESFLPRAPAMLPLLLVAVLLRIASAAFVETYSVGGLSTSNYVLEKFIIDVALDTDNQLLKFFVNTRAYNDSLPEANSSMPVITDVNTETNRYTTFHVDIDFMGKTLILKNLRFCDMVAVKNTSLYESTYRYNSTAKSRPESTSSTSSLVSTDLGYPSLNGSSISRRFFNQPNANSSLVIPRLQESSYSFAQDNSSILELFSNSTGDLVECPLYQNDSLVLYYQADISDHYSSLGSYTVTFTVVSNQPDSSVIGGAKCYVTPVLQPRILSSVLSYGVLSIFLAATAVNYVIMMFSPDQESSNPYLIEASTICNANLLKQLDAGSTKIVSYLQFALYMGGLDLQYPGFYQPFIGQIRWCALLGINLLKTHTSIPNMQNDDVYITLQYGGLKSLALYSWNGFIHYSWPNFMVCLLSWIGITIVVYQVYIGLRLLTKNFRSIRCQNVLVRLIFGSSEPDTEHAKHDNFVYSFKKNAWAHVGNFLRQFLLTFGYSFLVLTLFMLYTAGTMNNKSGVYYNQNMLRVYGFNPSIPYDFLVPGGFRNITPSNSTSQGLGPPPPQNGSLIPKSSIIEGVIALTLWLGLVLFFIFKYLFTIHVGNLKLGVGVSRLYTSVKSIIVWSYYYNLYQPDKVRFVLVEIVAMVLNLIVVGLLQKNGTVQVVCMIVIEFVHFILINAIKPFYVRNSWYSLSSIIHGARFVTSMLCIPYIRALEVLEASRTYVAYTQLILHFLIALIFLGHLFYCLYLTVTALMASNRKTRNASRHQSESNGIADIFNDQFEYRPIVKTQNSLRGSSVLFKDMVTPQTSAEREDEVNYYRSQSEKILLRVADATPPQRESSGAVDFEEGLLAYQQAEHRQTKNDYTTREGDRIYQKFFSGEEIDPEIKNLWASRDWNSEAPMHAKEGGDASDQANKNQGALTSLWSKLRPAPVKGFEVSRPRPLVVKPLAFSKEPSSTDLLSRNSGASINKIL